MAKLAEEYKTGNVTVGEFGKLSSDLFVVNYKPKQDFVVSSENGKTIVLDITIDENLMKEGVLRELIRQIQVYRKEANFKVEQRIELAIKSNSELINDVVKTYKDKILAETLAVSLSEELTNADMTKDANVADENVTISLRGI